MERVVSFNIARANKDQLLAFALAVVSRAESDSKVTELCEIALQKLKQRLSKYESLAQRHLINLLTIDVQELDAWRDANFTNIRKAIYTELKNPVPALRKKAKMLWKIVDDIGLVYDQQYDEQSGALTTLFDDLMNDHFSDLEALGLVDEVRKARQANIDFISKLEERTAVQSEFFKGSSEEARKELQQAYRDFVVDLNAAVINGHGEELQPFIGWLNSEIRRLALAIKMISRRASDDPLRVKLLFHYADGTTSTRTGLPGDRLKAPKPTHGCAWLPAPPNKFPTAPCQFTEERISE